MILPENPPLSDAVQHSALLLPAVICFRPISAPSHCTSHGTVNVVKQLDRVVSRGVKT